MGNDHLVQSKAVESHFDIAVGCGLGFGLEGFVQLHIDFVVTLFLDISDPELDGELWEPLVKVVDDVF